MSRNLHWIKPGSIFLVFFILARLYIPVIGQTEPFDLYVNSTVDGDDINPGDGICDASIALTGEQCTLRAAVSEANAYNGDLDMVFIHVPAGTYNLTLPPQTPDTNTGGDLDFDNFQKAILVEGDPLNYPVIDANGIDRVITNYNANYGLELRNLVIRGGRLDSTGGEFSGAGISNQGNLNLDSVIIEDNAIVCTDPIKYDCDYLIGGGIINYRTLQISNATIQNNSAYRGGGLFNVGGERVALIRNTTFKGNTANVGGAIVNYAVLTITNSTISNNSGDFGVGGIDNNKTLKLGSVTIADNYAPSGGVNLATSGDPLEIQNTIISNGAGLRNCTVGTDFLSKGYNLSSDDTCNLNPLGSDLINTDPLLLPLGNWGGMLPGQTTWTHALEGGSPAINAGNPAGCVDVISGYVLSYDQRGQPRPLNGCDMGAVEGGTYFMYLPLIRR